MRFYSTTKKSPAVGFKEAVFKSLPSDNGLYFPERIPVLDVRPDSVETVQELATSIMAPYCKEDIPGAELEAIVKEAINFDLPLAQVSDHISSLELFHGPTYAFKDVGARFLARCLAYFNRQENRQLTILVATSGDTGGAVASGFFQVPGVEVVILYPAGKVSELQEKQLTTLGHNIKALKVDGTFDDCQSLVKQAFLDKKLNQEYQLSSANSINIARWIPQSIYFYWTALQVSHPELVIAVPSGNYGNLASGLLAKRMGAPIKRFLAASNLNDVVPRYLASGSYDPRATLHTYSNAMDVGNPSNFPRLLELCDGSHERMSAEITGGFIDDATTLSTIQEVYDQHNYLLDPHGAVGYKVLEQHLANTEKGIFLETAHPCKFIPVIEKVVSNYEPPLFTKSLYEREMSVENLGADYGAFKEWMLK